MTVKILAVSDNRLPHFLNAEYLHTHYSDADILVSCGDMDTDYLDFIASVLTLPLYYVRGNHDWRYDEEKPGGIDLHRRLHQYKGVTLAGLEGSIRYNKGDIQYTEFDMFWQMTGFLPGMLLRRFRKGYGVDVLVTHSPPRGIHDRADVAHRGFKTMRWFMRWVRPRYLIHGHIDIYDQRTVRETPYAQTLVINVNPSRLLTVETMGKEN